MAMNKAGQATLVGLMVFVFVFIAAVALIPSLKTVIDDARSTTHLDCDNTSISLGQQATCLVVDIYMFYFMGVVIFGAGSYLIFRRVFSD